MVTRGEVRGLCVSCGSNPICTFHRHRLRPVLQCEEFEGYPFAGRPKKMPRLQPVALHLDGNGAEGRRGLSHPMGLCRNCDRLPECRFPKPEGGVWHCEEYE